MNWPKEQKDKFNWFIYMGLVESGLIVCQVHFLIQPIEKFILHVYSDHIIDLSYL